MLIPQDKHSGWTNYETFLVGLWIDNNQRVQEAVFRTIDDSRPGRRSDDLRLKVKSWIPEHSHDLTFKRENEHPPDILAFQYDMARAAIDRANWEELLAYFLTKAKEIEEHESARWSPD